MGIRTEYIFNTFGGGVLSPKLYGRTDTQKYYSGARQIQNMICTPQGTLIRRPGTFYVAETKTSSKASVLVPFVASSETAYILEFGHNYIRFYTSAAQVMSGGSVYEVRTFFDESEVADITFCQSVDVLYLFHANHAPQTLTHTSSTSWTLADFDYQKGPWLTEREKDDGTIAADSVTIAVSATAKDATGVTITASSALFQGTSDDVGRLVRIRHELKWGVIKITAAVSTTEATGTIKESFLYTTASRHWMLGAWSPGMGWPMFGCFHQERLWTGRNSTRGQTMWGSVVGDYTNFDPNVETSGAQYVTNGEFDNGSVNWLGTTGWTISGGVAQHNSGTTKLYQSVAVNDGHKYRLRFRIVGGTTGTVTPSMAFSSPITFTARVGAGQYEEYFTAANPGGSAINLGFTPTTGWDGAIDDVWIEDIADILITGADSGMSLTLGSDTYDMITWLSSQQSTLLAGTIGGVNSLKGGGDGAPITPTSYRADRENAYPAQTMKPAPFGSSLLYVQKGGLVVRDIGYSIQSDSFDAQDLTIWADHITSSGLIQIARQVSPFHVLWGVRSDGKLVGLTYEKNQQVVAWHLHETDGTYESIAIIPGSTEDQVWFIVKRSINGSDVRYVERADVINFSSLMTAHYVDCGVYETGTDMTSVATLTHLEGESVQVAGDGVEQDDQTVASGAITVTACDYCHAGLGFDSIVETMDVELSNGKSSIMGKQKRVIGGHLMFYRTAAGVKAGYITAASANGVGYEYNLNVLLEEDETVIVLAGGEDAAFVAGATYAAVEHVEEFDIEEGKIYTGKKYLSNPGGWGDSATIYAVMAGPLPMGINAIVMELEVGDR